MKFTFLSLFLISFLFFTKLQAQKSKVLSAFNYEQAYYSSKDCKELVKAHEAIELALTHEATAEWAKTWFYRGNIYFSIYASEDDQCRRISTEALDEAYMSYMKSISLDEKGRFIKDIEPKISVIASFYLQRGAVHFNTKKYEKALADFEKAIEVSRYFKKTDTVALYNAALSSEKLKNFGKAVLYYEGLIDIGHRDARVFHFLAEAYLKNGEKQKAFQAIQKGRISFPENHDLIIDELNMYLDQDQTQLALDHLDNAIEKMPDNAELYFTKGTILDKMEEWEMAKSAYEKSLSYKPDYFNANYNLGALFFNQGVEYVNKANEMKESEVKKFQEANKKSEEYFKKALPYLEKANQIDPHDRATLNSLKNLYARMGNDEGYKRVSNILDN